MAKDALKAESRLFKVGSRWPLSCAMNSVFPSVTGRFAAGLRVAATCGEEAGEAGWMHAVPADACPFRRAGGCKFRPVVVCALGRQHACVLRVRPSACMCSRRTSQLQSLLAS